MFTFTGTVDQLFIELIQLGQYFDDILIAIAIVVSILAFIRSIKYNNIPLLRGFKLILVILFALMHWVVIPYRKFFPPSAFSFGMETELVCAATYMATNALTAFILMLDRRRKPSTWPIL